MFPEAVRAGVVGTAVNKRDIESELPASHHYKTQAEPWENISCSLSEKCNTQTSFNMMKLVSATPLKLII